MTPRRRLFCLVVIFGLLASTGALAQDDPRLRQAEQLAKKKERDAAIDLYRAVLDDAAARHESDPRDGADVRYNLGTLCLESGDLGCAVLHLRAAARLDPRDDDVRHNLAVALEARTDRLAGSPVVDPLREIGARVPPTTARLALAIPLALLGLALVLVAFAPARARPMARIAATLAALACVAGGVIYAARKSVEATHEAVVVVPETPALKEPDTSSTVAFTAHAGLHGDVMARESTANGELLRVRFENGLEAWLKRSDVAVIE
jgi:tetratricopeptide (TPR) repeat protein